VIAVYKLGFNSAVYSGNTIDFVTDLDVVSGLVKAARLRLRHHPDGRLPGLSLLGRRPGRGAATTNAVVSASIMILVLNYFLTEVFFSR
jgi:phospholipid/cholesterol/gamma-HCH transport system permease protein